MNLNGTISVVIALTVSVVAQGGVPWGTTGAFAQTTKNGASLDDLLRTLKTDNRSKSAGEVLDLLKGKSAPTSIPPTPQQELESEKQIEVQRAEDREKLGVERDLRDAIQQGRPIN
jgi:hypothetical protein